MMIKVYCERGAMRKELKQLKQDGLVQLIHFPYEGHNKKVEITDIPSLVTADMTYMTADSTIPIGACDPSDKYEAIKLVIGSHEFDTRHIDTAYKNKCQVFLSRDKDDVVGHAKELNDLLGLEFLHPDDDWEYFINLVREKT